MKTIKRNAKIGERIVITDAQKGWNGCESANGAIMTVTEIRGLGVHTKEMYPIYVNHEGYEVIEEDVK